MNSRPLLDYIAYPDHDHHAEAPAAARDHHDQPRDSAPAPVDTLEGRLKDLEARLRAYSPAAPAPRQDLTLSAQIESILRRKAPQPVAARPAASPHHAVEPSARPARIVIDPPPSVPAIAAAPSIDPDFVKFTEAVYLIGQAARRFADQPQATAAPVRRPVPASSLAPSTAEIEALSAVLRDTVASFRSVADDLAVSAGEIRHFATRGERARQSARTAAVRDDANASSELQETVAAFRSVARELADSVGELRAAARHDDRSSRVRRDRRERYRDDEDEIHDLRDTVDDLQDRLDTLLQARRRTRY